MVLLDDPKPKNKEKKPLTKGQKIIRWIWRVIWIGAVLLGISLFVMMKIGGDNPALKDGIAQFLKQTSGYDVEIGTFDHMTFYPKLGVSLGDVRFKNQGDSSLYLKVDTFRFSTGFWDVFLSRRRVNTLLIEGAQFSPEVVGGPALRIDRMALQEKTIGDQPGLQMRGAYGGQPLALDLTLARKALPNDKAVFFLAPDNQLRFSFGPLSATAHLNDQNKNFMLSDLAATVVDPADENKVLSTITGWVSAANKRDDLDVKSELSWGTSQMKAALSYGDETLDGTIDFPVLDGADIAPLFGLTSAIAGLFDHQADAAAQTSDEPLDLPEGNVLDLRVNIATLRLKDETLGTLRFPVTLRDKKLTIGALNGTISQGKLTGQMSLDTAAAPARFSMKAGLDQMDYGLLQTKLYGRENVTGTVDIRAELTSEGATSEALRAGLRGEAFLIAGQGQMTTNVFNIWGQGLVNALLPSLDPASETTLNCAIADFKIENGIAVPDPFFVDTERVTVAGKGKIDLTQETINVQLVPKAKNIALLDVSPAVNIKGPLTKPSIGPDTLSVGATLGGLLLGAINPAFLALSLTDLGLTERHPCHKFIAPPEGEQEKQDAPAPKETGQVNE